MSDALATETRIDGSTLELLYDALFDPSTPNGDSDVDERFVRLGSLDQIHFLDAHACLLLARARYTPVVVLREPATEHVRARLAVNVVEPDTADEGAGLFAHYDPARGASIDYAPGALLSRLFRVHNWRTLWHNYLTSRDRILPAPAACATLDAKHPHLRLGFVAGIDLFNRGEFYRAHEEWEALWMRLDAGVERNVAQGLIQLAGAHLHRLKRRAHEAHKLYALAARHLETAHELDWLDAPALLDQAHLFFDAPGVTGAVAVARAPSINPRIIHTDIARKHR